MYSKLRRYLLPALSALVVLLTVIAMLLLVPFTGGTAYAEEEGNMTVENSTDSSSRYNNERYKNFYGVKSSEILSYEANGGEMDTYSLAQAFDDADNTYWMTSEGNSDTFKNYVIVRFTKVMPIQRIRYVCSYYTRNNVRNYSGYPATLKVYTANGDGEFTLAGTCVSMPAQDYSSVVFSLPTKFECDKIKLEFTEVTVFSEIADGAKIFATGGLSFFKSDEGITETQKAEGNYADTTYLAGNSVTADEMKVRSNGGGAVENAFDKITSTFWQTESYNTDLFTNKITVTMNNEQTLCALVYYASYYTRTNGRNFSGFPTLFDVKATAGDGSVTQYTFGGNPESDWTLAQFVFPEPVTCVKLELEFTEVTTFSEIANGMPVASAGEIYLVRPINANTEAMLERINGIFTDYAQYEVNPEVSLADIERLRNEAKLLSGYENNLKPILDRAGAILSGSMKKDPYREFSTDPNAKNPIEQYGQLANYCRNTLRMTSFGTDRQVIGIGGTTGETITIYVEADEGDPLPQLAFTQIYGSWQSWLRTYELHRGKNEIVFPNFKAGAGYSVAVNAGGPIHIMNPYTPEQQSSNVKLYFEGGYIYPVFHDGDDEGTFKVILKDYYERLMDPNDSSITIDAFEAVTDNVILSTKASSAYDSYVNRGTSPQNNINKWKNYTKTTLAYGGVEFDPSKPYYDRRNERIKVNYRTVQPYAGFYAFAAYEHVGLPSSDLHSAMVQYWTLGWAFYHEMGHQLDNSRMMIGEVTNNMWAIYNVYMKEGSINDRINVTGVSQNLASDLSDKVGNYWYNGNSNCDFWWILEGVCPGYWGRLQQLYCFEYQTTELDKAITNSVERLCYYSSLAIGEDASAYFERFGFYFNLNANQKFTKAGASQAFNNAMAAAKAAGRIKDTDKKYWYVNNGQYRQIRAHGETLSAEWGSCYDTSQTVAPLKIMGSSGSYTLLLPEPAKPEAHLCYEIQSYINGEWKVIGVTDGTSFADRYNYGGATPQYKVYAYDRFFNHTGEPKNAVSPQTVTQTNVCRIGDVYYNSLKEAVSVANNNTGNQAITIYLLKDFEDGGVVFSRSSGRINVLPDPDIFTDGKSVTITKNAPGDLFDMIWGNVWIGSATNNVPTSSPIILDGGSFSQSGTLVRTHGKEIYLNNVTMQNNINSGSGGGLSADYGTTMSLNGCTIKNNRASDGGGIATYSYAAVTIRGLTITGNVASGKGGGIYAGSGEYSVVCRDINGSYPDVIISGNRAANGGGVYAERTVELNKAQIINNIATQNGGGVYTAMDNASRYIKLSYCMVKGNTAVVGDAIYMYSGATRLAGTKVCGGMYKYYGANTAARLELYEALSDFTECEIRVSKTIPKEGLTLCEVVTGIQPDEITEPAKAYNVYNGNAEFVFGTGVVINPLLATVTITGGGETFTTEMSYGNFTLPDKFEGLPDDRYIESYTVNGKTYAVGESLPVTGDFTATAVIKKYCTVTLIYGAYSEKYSTLKEGDVYYLPMKTKDNEVVFGWNCSDGNYYAYAEGVKIVRDTVFNAVIKQLHTVTTIVEGAETSALYEYGGAVTLASPPAVFGKVFSHWDIDGKKYQPNQTLKVTGNIVATAVYTDTWTVITIVGDDEKTERLPAGKVIALDACDALQGREFKYWLIGGVKYYAGSSYTVNADSEIVAVFGQVDTQLEITVTFVVNKGPLPDSEEIVENETTKLEYAFNAVHTFTEPAVNAGNKFLYWDVNGVHFTAGSKITVTEAFTATAAVTRVSEDETPAVQTVTVSVTDYGSDGALKTEEYTYNPNTQICLFLPSGKHQGKVFSHWLVNGETYQAGDIITVAADATVQAVYDVAYTVTVANGNDRQTYEYGNGRLFVLHTPVSDGEELFSYWLVDGERYEAGDSFAVTKDTAVVAVYTQPPKAQITKIWTVNGEEHRQTFSQTLGGTYVLDAPESDGREFLYWDVNGVRYEAGTTLFVFEDTVITAVYKTPDTGNHDANSGPEDGGANVGLIIGTIAGVVVLLGAGAAVAVILIRRKKGTIVYGDEDSVDDDN